MSGAEEEERAETFFDWSSKVVYFSLFIYEHKNKLKNLEIVTLFHMGHVAQ